MTKILLVEDDKSLREIYGTRLLAEGYDIVSAGDGEEALAMAIKDRPQLIISDVMMPKISGFDMLDILRSTTETKDIKVIMMTALSSEDQRQRGVSLGADRYLVKSQVGIEDVVRTVHEILGDAPVVGQPPLMTPHAPTPAPSNVQPIPATPPAAPGPQLAPAPTPQPAPGPSPTTLPQPTAPFSTPRNPGSSMNRVIQPPTQPSASPDFANLMNKELSGAPATLAQPRTPEPGMNFEETPRPTPPQPAQAPSQPQPAPAPQTQAPTAPPQQPTPQSQPAPQAPQTAAQQPPAAPAPAPQPAQVPSQPQQPMTPPVAPPQPPAPGV